MRYTKKRSLLIKRKHIKIIAPILAAVIIIVGIILLTAPGRERSQKEKAVEAVSQMEILNIGLRTDLGAFCTYNTDTGEFEGFEKDVLDEVLARLFGGDMIVNYTEVNSKTKDALIRTGELDIALGASIASDTKTIAYSAPFLTDGNAFMVLEGAMINQKALNGKEIAIVHDSYVSRENEDDVMKIDEHLAQFNISANIRVYASYPEAVAAMESGHVDAVCASELYLKLFGKKGMLILPERFLPQGYCIETRSDLATFCEAMGDVIDDMKRDGTMDALKDIWNLSDYNELTEQ